MENVNKLKHEILSLLKEDLEFRYAIAGLIGLEEILKRLDRHEEILIKHSEELVKLREDMLKGFLRHDEEIAKLREDMNKGFELMERHISALGARWGLLSEEAFREGLKGLLEKEFKLKVERWSHYDEAGIVYGYPSLVELDIAIHNEKTILIEVSSHIRSSDVAIFKRKAGVYERLTGKKPEKLMVVTPYAEEKAKEACIKHGIELYTKV
ncbi:MAG: DUF3782 domain-containing protein [Candidatus Bathyarchaeia archaeon]